MRWVLNGLPLSPRTPAGLGLSVQAPQEEGGSHLDVACSKAQAWSRVAGMAAISSDGGLVIPALGVRWDSLSTHRFAGPDADDDARLERIIDLMRPYRGAERTAWWVEALAIAEGGRTIASWQVRGATGLLLEAPGSAPTVPGFWAFSLWYIPHLKKTYNELDEGELERLNDHWHQLKSLVQLFYREKRET